MKINTFLFTPIIICETAYYIISECPGVKGRNKYYQEDDPLCTEWFDKENSYEPTVRAKQFLRGNLYPLTKDGICSAKVRMEDFSPDYQANKYTHRSDSRELKKNCEIICDYCPEPINPNDSIERYDTKPKIEPKTTEKTNQGIKRLFIIFNIVNHFGNI